MPEKNLDLPFGTVALVLLIIGCGEPRIDASTDEKMKLSIEKVRSPLSVQERETFDKAVQVVAFNNIELGDLFASGSVSGLLDSKVKQALDGKTARELIASAKALERERAEKEREQALQEIRELEGKRVSAERDKIELAKCKVLRSRFLKEPQDFLGPQPIIELTIVNETPHAISRAYFMGTLGSPGRLIPWVKDSFSHEISGGLEPGEQVSWRLAPNMFSKWGSVEAPADAVFTVDVVRLDGADGKPLFSAEQFTEHDAKRLEELKRKFPQ